MKQLTCELCGGNEFVKQDGYFVCKGCETKYSADEARKMLASDPSEAKAPTMVDNDEKVNNLVILAEENLEDGTWDTGFNACEKALELNPRSWKAWELKAKYLIRHGNRPDTEIISTINSAGKYAGDNKSQIVDALVKLRFAHFASDRKNVIAMGMMLGLGYNAYFVEVKDLSAETKNELFCMIKDWYSTEYKKHFTEKYQNLDKYICQTADSKTMQGETWFQVNELSKLLNAVNESAGIETRYPVCDFVAFVHKDIVNMQQKFVLGEESIMSLTSGTVFVQFFYRDIKKTTYTQTADGHLLRVETKQGKQHIFGVLNSKIADGYCIDDFLKMIQILETKVQEHEGEASAEVATVTKKGCYVATCVYGSYDCPEVWALRRYRDDVLGITRRGRVFIRLYYAISPTLVKWFGKTAWFQRLWKKPLDRMVTKLRQKGVPDTPYEDRDWRK